MNLFIYFKGCRLKVHKEHLDSTKDELIAPCKVYKSAKELYLLAGTNNDQQKWIAFLRSKIQKSGYAAKRRQSNLSIKSNPSTSPQSPRMRERNNTLHRSYGLSQSSTLSTSSELLETSSSTKTNSPKINNTTLSTSSTTTITTTNTATTTSLNQKANNPKSNQTTSTTNSGSSTSI